MCPCCSVLLGCPCLLPHPWRRNLLLLLLLRLRGPLLLVLVAALLLPSWPRLLAVCKGWGHLRARCAGKNPGKGAEQ